MKGSMSSITYPSKLNDINWVGFCWKLSPPLQHLCRQVYIMPGYWPCDIWSWVFPTSTFAPCKGKGAYKSKGMPLRMQRSQLHSLIAKISFFGEVYLFYCGRSASCTLDILAESDAALRKESIALFFKILPIFFKRVTKFWRYPAQFFWNKEIGMLKYVHNALLYMFRWFSGSLNVCANLQNWLLKFVDFVCLQLYS